MAGCPMGSSGEVSSGCSLRPSVVPGCLTAVRSHNGKHAFGCVMLLAAADASLTVWSGKEYGCCDAQPAVAAVCLAH